MWHGVLLVMVSSTWGQDGRNRQLAGSTRKRRSLSEGVWGGFPLLLGNAEEVPRPDASFDFAISEYGASIWCDPYRWIPEASRLLRAGGYLIFMVNASLLMLCVPDEETVPADQVLKRDYFGMHRFEWPNDDSVEFHLGHGELIRLLRENNLTVEKLIEARPPSNASTGYDYVTLDWARRWPSEEIWVARKLH